MGICSFVYADNNSPVSAISSPTLTPAPALSPSGTVTSVSPTTTPSVGMTPTGSPVSAGTPDGTLTPNNQTTSPGTRISPTVGPASHGAGAGSSQASAPPRVAGWASSNAPVSVNRSDTPFRMPYSVAVDSHGNVDVADSLHCRIRQIDPDGGVTTLAGSYSRDAVDGNGTDASFDFPTGIAIDASGNVYIADSGDDMIRKMNGENDVSTVAGQAGVTGASNGTGRDALFNDPWAVAVDSTGNLYIADMANNLIRKITPKGVVSTLAGGMTPGSTDGTGSAASFNRPMGIAVDTAGNVFVADTANHLIRKITSKGEVTTLAGGGAGGAANGHGSAASFNWPSGIAIDASGNLFVADSGNSLIRKITSSGEVSTYAGPKIRGTDLGPANDTAKFLPYGVAVDSKGQVYGVDPFNGLVRIITPN